MEHAKIYRTKDQGSFEKKLGVGIKDDRKKNSIATKQSNHFCQLFERTKQIYKRKDIEGFNYVEFVAELINIQSQFQDFGHKKGVIFTQKALSIIHEKQGDQAIEIGEKIFHFELAHDCINSAVIQATHINWVQPGLLKHQAIIKNKLGDCLHQFGDHHNANILESDSSKIFGKILFENQDYAEGYIEAVSASLSKIKWVLKKTLFELNKGENYFSNPSYRKHLPDEAGLQTYQVRINEMRKTINLLLSVAQ